MARLRHQKIKLRMRGNIPDSPGCVTTSLIGLNELKKMNEGSKRFYRSAAASIVLESMALITFS